MIRCAYFVGSKRLTNDRKPLFTVLRNLRVKILNFLVTLIISLLILLSINLGFVYVNTPVNDIE